MAIAVFVVCALLLLVLVWPVRVHLEFAPLRFKLTWLFLSFRLFHENKQLQRRWHCFGVLLKRRLPKRQRQRKKREAQSEKASRKERRGSSPEPVSSVPKRLLLVRHDPIWGILVRKLYRLGRRIRKAVKITFFRCQIGVSDYYWQGIITGWVSCFPESASFSVQGNFQEFSHLKIACSISIWRLLVSVLLLLLLFPYLKAYRVYKRLR